MPPTANKAPLGIKIICVLAAIGTVLSLLGGLGMLGLAGTRGIPGWYALLGLVSTLTALLNLPMIYGLWTVKGWGWTLAMVLYGINVVLNGLSLLFGNASAIISVVLSLVILAYIGSKADVYGKQLLGPGAGPSRRGGPRR